MNKVYDTKFLHQSKAFMEVTIPQEHTFFQP